MEGKREGGGEEKKRDKLDIEIEPAVKGREGGEVKELEKEKWVQDGRMGHENQVTQKIITPKNLVLFQQPICKFSSNAPLASSTPGLKSHH